MRIKTFELAQIGRNEIRVPAINKLLQITFDNIRGPILAHYQIVETEDTVEHTEIIYIFKEGEEIRSLGGDLKFINLVKPFDQVYYCYLNHSGW